MSSPDPHPASLPPEQLLRDCEVRRVRRSGPGGQRRNKVETGVVVAHRPTGVEAEAAESRSQAENRSAAVKRLRLKLALQVRRPVEPDRPPSPLWRSRCRGGRISVNPRHPDFPPLLAEALDALAAHGMDPASAAEQLGCTPSQLIKLLKQEPRALAGVNSRREELGLRRLK